MGAASCRATPQPRRCRTGNGVVQSHPVRQHSAEGRRSVVYGRGHVRRVASLRLLRRGLLGGDPRRRCGHPALAAVARRRAQVPARPDGIGPHAAAGHLGPARAARAATASWWSPACAPGGRRARSCRTSSRRTCSPSPRRVTRWRRSAWPPRSWSAASPDVVIGSFAADHVIRDAAAFRGASREAVAAARDRLHRHDRHRARRSRRPGSATSTSASRCRSTAPRTRLAVERVRREARRRHAPAPGWRRASTAGTPGMFVVRATCCWTSWRPTSPSWRRGLRVAGGGRRSGWRSCGRG